MQKIADSLAADRPRWTELPPRVCEVPGIEVSILALHAHSQVITRVLPLRLHPSSGLRQRMAYATLGKLPRGAGACIAQDSLEAARSAPATPLIIERLPHAHRSPRHLRTNGFAGAGNCPSLASPAMVCHLPILTRTFNFYSILYS